MKVTLIVPAYNVAHLVGNVLKRIPNGIVDEIIALDDGSHDKTFETISGIDGVLVLRHHQNQGYGGAQITLFDVALERNADVIVIMHADGGHFPEELPQLIDPVKSQVVDIVIGSRIQAILDNAPAIMRSRLLGALALGPMPPHLLAGNMLVMSIHNFYFGTGYKTWHSGYRAMTRKAIQALPFHDFDRGYLFDAELLYNAHQAGLRILEVNVSSFYTSRPGSKVRPFAFGLSCVWFTLRKVLIKGIRKGRVK